MHVSACKMPEMHPKIVFWWFRVGKFDTLMLRPPRKSISSETRHLVQKRFTKACLPKMSYDARLSTLGLQTLETRRLIELCLT